MDINIAVNVHIAIDVHVLIYISVAVDVRVTINSRVRRLVSIAAAVSHRDPGGVAGACDSSGEALRSQEAN